MRQEFSNNWKSSKQTRKQRKYRYNAPLHIKRKFLGVHLSAELIKKYGKRTITIRTGDTVKVLRGNHKGKKGKIEKVDIKREKVSITGIEAAKKDGNKVAVMINPSNLVIEELNLDDKKRKDKLTKKSTKTDEKTNDIKGKKNG